jgi:hypothetical protein
MRSPARRLIALLIAVPACNGPLVSATADEASTTATTTSDGGPQLTTDLTPTTSEGSSGTTAEPPGGLAQGPLQAGVAVGYLTGPVGASMAGYGGRTPTNNTPWNDVLNGAAGFYGYGTAKAIALEVEGERLVLLKIPTMSSEASITEGTLAKLKDVHGIDLTGRLITGATHSHHNIARYWRLPKLLAAVGADSPDEEIIDRITTQLAQVVADAIADLGPAEWGTAAADDWDPDDHIYRDRRGANDPTYGKDPRLTILAVRRPGGAPMAAILNFGMHGTVFDSDNELFTEDAPGGLELKFEEHFFARSGTPIFAMFMQSGGGDASPAGDRFDHPGAARIELIGEDAAPKIYAAYEDVAWKSELRLGVRSRRIDLSYTGIGYDEIPEFKNAANYPYTWGGWQCTGPLPADDANPATSSEGMPKDCTDIKTLIEQAGETVPHGEVHQMYTTVASLDDFFLVTLPGEPTYSVVKHVREELQARDVRGMVVGYSQDHMLYLTHPDDWYQGDYESEMSLWGPLAATHIVGRQMELVEALKAGEGTPVWSEESANLSPPKPFEPRAIERSEDAGSLLQDVTSDIQRGETVRLGWGGGDPSLGDPRVVLQVEASPRRVHRRPVPQRLARRRPRQQPLPHAHPLRPRPQAEQEDPPVAQTPLVRRLPGPPRPPRRQLPPARHRAPRWRTRSPTTRSPRAPSSSAPARPTCSPPPSRTAPSPSPGPTSSPAGAARDLAHRRLPPARRHRPADDARHHPRHHHPRLLRRRRARGRHLRGPLHPRQGPYPRLRPHRPPRPRPRRPRPPHQRHRPELRRGRGPQRMKLEPSDLSQETDPRPLDPSTTRCEAPITSASATMHRSITCES